MASILDRALELGGSSEASFTLSDVDDNVHSASIESVTAAGLMNGCADGRFCPNDPITRGQLATVLQRAFDLPAASGDTRYFIDTRGTHEAAIDAIAEAGVSNGCGPVQFCTSDSLQRGHAAVFIARGLEMVERVSFDGSFDERLAEHERALAEQREAERRAAEKEAARVAAKPANRAVAVALEQLGKPYRWGGNGPHAFDCSGLTSFAWRAAGVELPRTSRQQYSATQRINRSQLRPGDLVFYHSPISHVAMYIGDGRVVEAPNSGNNVRIRNDGLTRRGVVGFGRVRG